MTKFAFINIPEGKIKLSYLLNEIVITLKQKGEETNHIMTYSKKNSLIWKCQTYRKNENNHLCNKRVQFSSMDHSFLYKDKEPYGYFFTTFHSNLNASKDPFIHIRKEAKNPIIEGNIYVRLYSSDQKEELFTVFLGVKNSHPLHYYVDIDQQTTFFSVINNLKKTILDDTDLAKDKNIKASYWNENHSWKELDFHHYNSHKQVSFTLGSKQSSQKLMITKGNYQLNILIKPKVALSNEVSQKH